jgi:hypothetical protein
VVWIFKDGGHLLRWVRRFDTEQTSKRGGPWRGTKAALQHGCMSYWVGKAKAGDGDICLVRG